MSQIQKIPWPRVLGEGVIIVVSILLAFWIQAWWDARQESIEEEAILTSLLDAFLEKKSLLARERPMHEAILASTKRLLEVGLSADSTIAEREVNEHLADIWWVFDESDWRIAILEGLIDSGDISLVSNSELRRILGAWPLRLERVQLYYRNDMAFYFRAMQPYLISNGFLPAVANQETHAPGDPNQTIYSTKYIFENSIENASLLENVEFQNLLVEKTYMNENILLIAFDGLDEGLDDTIEMIQTELSN